VRYGLYYVDVDHLKKMKAGERGMIHVAPDHLETCGVRMSTVSVGFTIVDFEQALKLAKDIRDYLNMQEEAKNEAMKNKTIASAVLKRMGDEQK
jgi:hypothetical protein